MENNVSKNEQPNKIDPEEFERVANEYGLVHPIRDSIVRLEQEDQIAETLRSGEPVLIRGVWRMGKTSMALSLGKHKFGEENSLPITLPGKAGVPFNSVNCLSTCSS